MNKENIELSYATKEFLKLTEKDQKEVLRVIDFKNKMKSQNVRKYENVVIRNNKEIGINNYGLDYMVDLEQRLFKAIDYINNCLIGYEEQYEEHSFNYQNVSYDLENILEILEGKSE